MIQCASILCGMESGIFMKHWRNLESNTRFLGGDPLELGRFLKCIPAIVHRDLTTGCFSMGGNFDFWKGQILTILLVNLGGGIGA